MTLAKVTAMPRATRYLLPGYTYHLTHRCHDRQWLLRFGRDRDAYQEWLRLAARRYRVPIYGYCITSSHVHVVVHAEDTERVSSMMDLAAGVMARLYNRRKVRSGSFWEHPYHCTAIESGRHLLNCLVYVDLNMVRAGVVTHPKQWRWCGYHELTGQRKRYRLLDLERLLESLGNPSTKELQAWHADALAQRLSQQAYAREAYWTESLAVGSERFVASAAQQYAHRRHFLTESFATGNEATPVWTVRESREPYGTVSD